MRSKIDYFLVFGVIFMAGLFVGTVIVLGVR